MSPHSQSLATHPIIGPTIQLQFRLKLKPGIVGYPRRSLPSCFALVPWLVHRRLLLLSMRHFVAWSERDSTWTLKTLSTSRLTFSAASAPVV